MIPDLRIQVARVGPVHVPLPRYQTAAAPWMDLHAPGTVDSDHRGEGLVLPVNLSDAPVTIAPLERVAQLVIVPVARAELVISVELGATARGDGGYGSTGSG